MDGDAFFDGFSRACGRGRFEGRIVAARVGGTIWHRDQHGHQLGTAFSGNGKVAPGQMGGHKPKAIAGEHEVFLGAASGSGFTCAGSWARSPSAASRPTTDGLKVVPAEKLSFKKNRG